MLVFIWCLLLFAFISNSKEPVNSTSQFYQNISLLEQLSTSDSQIEYSSIPCQKIIDIRGTPILTATDDFVIEENTVCKSIAVKIKALRKKWSQDPVSATLHIFKEGPELLSVPSVKVSEIIVDTPDNGWGDAQVKSGQELTFSFSTGDLPEEELSSGTYWISFFADLDRDFKLSGYKENRIFWATSSTQSSGSDYYFRDESNFLRNGWVNWTTAAEVEDKLGINNGTRNLAFSVEGLCKYNGSVSEPPPSPESVLSPSPTPYIYINNTNSSVESPSPRVKNGTSVKSEPLQNSNIKIKIAMIFGMSMMVMMVIMIIWMLIRSYRRKKVIEDSLPLFEHYLKDKQESSDFEMEEYDPIIPESTEEIQKTHVLLGYDLSDEDTIPTDHIIQRDDISMEDSSPRKGWIKSDNLLSNVSLTYEIDHKDELSNDAQNNNIKEIYETKDKEKDDD